MKYNATKNNFSVNVHIYYVPLWERDKILVYLNAYCFKAEI